MTVLNFLKEFSLHQIKMAIQGNILEDITVEFIDHDNDTTIAEHTIPDNLFDIPEYALGVEIFSVEQKVDNRCNGCADIVIHIIYSMLSKKCCFVSNYKHLPKGEPKGLLFFVASARKESTKVQSNFLIFRAVRGCQATIKKFFISPVQSSPNLCSLLKTAYFLIAAASSNRLPSSKNPVKISKKHHGKSPSILTSLPTIIFLTPYLSIRLHIFLIAHVTSTL